MCAYLSVSSISLGSVRALSLEGELVTTESAIKFCARSPVERRLINTKGATKVLLVVAPETLLAARSGGGR